jgi:hypothetical protein
LLIILTRREGGLERSKAKTRSSHPEKGPALADWFLLRKGNKRVLRKKLYSTFQNAIQLLKSILLYPTFSRANFFEICGYNPNTHSSLSARRGLEF